MTKSFRLYGRPGSGWLAVQVALEELAVPYERVWVGSAAADVERFRKINPTGKVPALELPDGTVMFESAAMLIHLALQNPNSGLAPAPGTGGHAIFLQWISFMSANIYEAALRSFIRRDIPCAERRMRPRYANRGRRIMPAYLSLFGQALNPYVLGAQYSVADAYLYMLASWFPEKDGLFARLPALGAHAAKMANRAAVVKVDADHAQHG